MIIWTVKVRLHRRFLLRSFSFWCMRLNGLTYECIRPSVSKLYKSILLWLNHSIACVRMRKIARVNGPLRYVYTLRLIGPISYLDACYIRTKVTKCIREKTTMYFHVWTIKSHSPEYEIGPIWPRSCVWSVDQIVKTPYGLLTLVKINSDINIIINICIIQYTRNLKYILLLRTLRYGRRKI